MAIIPRIEILLGDEFTENEGQFTNYAALPIDQDTQLNRQKHTDIRSMVQSDLAGPINMLYLDLLVMSNLDLKTMNDLNGTVVVRRGERWSEGVFGPQADRNHWNGMSLSCTTGLNITQSILVT